MDGIPKLMQAVLLKGHGGFEQLELRHDVLVPIPAADEVLIRVRAAAVNNTDINLRSGWYSQPTQGASWTGAAMQFPRIQGADACGTIVAAGSAIDPHRISERVIVDPVLRDALHPAATPGYLGAERDGAFAEYLCVPARNAWAVTSSWSDAELASLPCSSLAAEHMLERAHVTAGDRVLITGASGGVGSAALQLARRRGAHVIAVAASGKLAALQELGADEVLARETDLAAVLGPESVDVVVDCVGGPAFPQYLKLLRPGGRYAVAGAIAGPVVQLDLRTLYLKDLTLSGCTIPAPGVFAQLIGYIARNEIRPLVSALLPLRSIVAAQQQFLQKSHIGKIVLTV
jgi:NADPH:quinone reductase-like Zn-dependent oxidoreductase